jgi:hypothetical protein
MAIWFAQLHRNEVRLIDYYEDNGKSFQHYIKVLKEKPYVYEEHFAPHDIEVREMSSGRTRRDIAMDLGIDFTPTPKHSLDDGHAIVRETLSKCWFDTSATMDGFSALMAYKKSYNSRTESYSDKPMRNWAKHGADAFRILCHNLENIEDTFKDSVPAVFKSLHLDRGRAQVHRSLSIGA